jgi:DNA/RNA endonuclease YhcR with UshA esterase domain
MKRAMGGFIAVLGLLVSGVPVLAHHSVQAEFDLKKPLTVTGVVTKVEWINPHSYLYLDVKDDSGNVKHWAFEMAGPGALRRAGLSRADRGGLKAGDTVTVNAVGAKDGTDAGLIKDVTLPDGRKFTIWTSDPNAK